MYTENNKIIFRQRYKKLFRWGYKAALIVEILMLMLGMDDMVMDGIIALISLIYSGLGIYLLKNNIDLRYNSEQDWDSWRTKLKLIAVYWA